MIWSNCNAPTHLTFVQKMMKKMRERVAFKRCALKPLSFIKFVNYTHAGAGCFFLLCASSDFFSFNLLFASESDRYFFFFFLYCVFSRSYFSNYISCQNICVQHLQFFLLVFVVVGGGVVVICAIQYELVSVDRNEFIHWVCYILLHFSSSLSKLNRVSRTQKAHNIIT